LNIFKNITIRKKQKLIVGETGQGETQFGDQHNFKENTFLVAKDRLHSKLKK